MFFAAKICNNSGNRSCKKNVAGAEIDRMIWMVAILAYGDNLDDSDAG